MDEYNKNQLMEKLDIPGTASVSYPSRGAIMVSQVERTYAINTVEAACIPGVFEKISTTNPKMKAIERSAMPDM